MSQDKLFNRVFITFGIVIAALQFFQAGEFMHEKMVTESIINIVLAAFWVFVVLIINATEQRRARYELVEKAEDQAHKAADKMIEGLSKFMDAQIEEKRNHDLIEAIIHDVVGKGKPNKKHVAKIVPAIFENTGLYADVSVNKNGGFDIGLSKEPIVPTPAPAKKKAAPGRSAAHAAAAKRGDAARAKVNKPVTKKKGTK